MTPSYPKVAFIGWNPFQFKMVKSLIKAIPNSVFIFEKKHNNIKCIDKISLANKELPITVTASKDIHKLNNIYDVIICQTVFTDIHKFDKAKIAMLQYGYAKEAHNYGPWRSLADICFTYGSYASKKISYFCPTREVGYIRKNEVNDPKFMQCAQKKYGHLLDKNKQTILYLPTWGEHNTSSTFLKKINSLYEKYNVLTKIHHNTDLLSIKNSRHLKNPNIHVFGANDDSLQLIMLSDLVISDYSGAIFDAIYCNKPVVLLNKSINLSSQNKVDEYSIEFKYRNKLGAIVNSDLELPQAIEMSLNQKTYIEDKLLNDLFTYELNAHEIIYDSIINLHNNKYKLNQQQLYTRSAMKEFYSILYSSKKYKAINLAHTLYSKLSNIRNPLNQTKSS